jgi:hypothetical protein
VNHRPRAALRHRQRRLRADQRHAFKLSNDPCFEEKRGDVVGLYLNPPEKAVVLCTDERSQIQEPHAV